MSRAKKTQIIEELQEEISESSIGILTDYRGLTNSQITVLRRKIQESNGSYRVVKNTLARFAAERADKADLGGGFEGPVAIAFGYGDMSEISKTLTDYIRTSGATVSIKSGFISDRVLTAEEIINIANLPPREVLLARVVGGMKSPINGLVNCLASPLRGLAGVLQARIQQLEGE
ncbi:MAG TPA: 50S ribosomal protein L10 [Dehalococcoidia bacterium]|nr:50S ribosomal protein L10 [Dehalococcoidia bacterium]